MEYQLPDVYLARDYPKNALHDSWRRGELARLRRGAYLPTDEVTEKREQALARALGVARSVRGRFAFSHETAALLHGLSVRLERPDVVYITQSTRPSADRASDVITHVTDLPESDVTTAAGLPVTTLHRTVTDCVRKQHPRRSMIVADEALRRLSGTTRFCDTSEAETEIRAIWLERLQALGPARGVVRARAVATHADGRAESPPESELRWLILTEDFPAPTLQMMVETDSGSYFPDLGWTGKALQTRARAVVLEYDGVAKYQNPDDLYAEKRREDALRRAGCHMIRLTKEDLREPHRFLQSLRSLVSPDPAGFPERRGLRTR